MGPVEMGAVDTGAGLMGAVEMGALGTGAGVTGAAPPPSAEAPSEDRPSERVRAADQPKRVRFTVTHSGGRPSARHALRVSPESASQKSPHVPEAPGVPDLLAIRAANERGHAPHAELLGPRPEALGRTLAVNDLDLRVELSLERPGQHLL